MFEVGVAVGRGDGPLSDTKVVVFQCTSESPHVFTDDLVVKITEKSIQQFTFRFHRDDHFFPTLGRAFDPELRSDAIHAKSQILYNKLSYLMKEIGVVDGVNYLYDIRKNIIKPFLKSLAHFYTATTKVAVFKSHPQFVD
jgi:hypothetical protein